MPTCTSPKMLLKSYFLGALEPDLLTFLSDTIAKLRWDEASHIPLLRVGILLC